MDIVSFEAPKQYLQDIAVTQMDIMIIISDESESAVIVMASKNGLMPIERRNRDKHNTHLIAVPGIHYMELEYLFRIILTNFPRRLSLYIRTFLLP